MSSSARYWRLSNFLTRGSAYLELGQLELWGSGAKLTGTLSCPLDPVTGALAALSDADLSTTAKWLVCPALAFVFDLGSAQTAKLPRFGAAALPEFVAAFSLEYSADGQTWVLDANFNQVIYPGAQTLTAATDSGNTDPHFANVSLLLHGNGSNGSTDFTDSSGTPKTATYYGAAHISTAQSMFGGASIRTPGSSGVMFADTNITTFGTENFTIEFWVRLDNLAIYALLNNYGYGASSTSLVIQASGATAQAYVYAEGNLSVSCEASGALITNTWTHLAFVRNGNVFTLYVNGLAGASVTSSVNITSVPTKLRLGMESDTGAYSVAAYFDDLRITKGVARYTTNFTPPAAALLDANTSGAAFTETPVPTASTLEDTVHIISLAAPPLGTVQTAGPEVFALTRHELSGRYQLSGTVKVTPATPVARKVRLYREPDGMLVNETWSDASTGIYAFYDIPEYTSYTVISYDHTETFRAVIADRITPTLMP
ncbi:MAG: LamG domain-containing protein [Rhodoferax sp.]|nr:LamG domain-containing protein [Rhodoferax sp.]